MGEGHRCAQPRQASAASAASRMRRLNSQPAPCVLRCSLVGVPTTNSLFNGRCGAHIQLASHRRARPGHKTSLGNLYKCDRTARQSCRWSDVWWHKRPPWGNGMTPNFRQGSTTSTPSRQTRKEVVRKKTSDPIRGWVGVWRTSRRMLHVLFWYFRMLHIHRESTHVHNLMLQIVTDHSLDAIGVAHH